MKNRKSELENIINAALNDVSMQCGRIHSDHQMKGRSIYIHANLNLDPAIHLMKLQYSTESRNVFSFLYCKHLRPTTSLQDLSAFPTWSIREKLTSGTGKEQGRLLYQHMLYLSQKSLILVLHLRVEIYIQEKFHASTNCPIKNFYQPMVQTIAPNFLLITDPCACLAIATKKKSLLDLTCGSRVCFVSAAECNTIRYPLMMYQHESEA